ncbi:RagB/SusD family nutrient uptake outer membrane protein [Sphingobacterium tabacisoli]|uniref:RagB/SusD family nutrient uptake outer membrane protein n=1 Tax=Sphingobacterium tabacisoli TaxID=2044855 RepID=A0ABW5L9F0_9SPHI|nr:RagB/SusD family nutrient uptake outer membrane protein [Sphingobacterium tabacisoli]
MNKLTFTLSLLCILTLYTSCNKWLDVQPSSQVKSSELFKTESGFKEALAGIYTILGEDGLYGKEMTYGMMGVLAQEWKNYPSSYNDDHAYNYNGTLLENRIEKVWSSLYNAISNTNHLLSKIDDGIPFTGKNHSIIKGEALALRAFLHFELLRCFGVSYAVNPTQPAIPYITEYSAKQTKQDQVQNVLAQILTDLKTAKELLRNDPIFTGEIITEMNDNGYLINRQLHLNYYAIEALFARIYLYSGQLDLAIKSAQEVINSHKFTFASQQDFIDRLDKSGAIEQIFGLQINNLTQKSVNFLSQEGENQFSLDLTTKKYYLNDDPLDYRETLFAQGTLSTSNENYYLTKYMALSTDLTNKISNPSYYQNKMPLIKLSEMYLILAEAQWRQGLDALPAFNAQRKARGLTQLTAIPVDFRSELTSEFRREFIGEGQLFHYYKRNNQATIYGTDVNMVSTKSYTFSIPVSESTSANREPNK